MDDNWGEKDGRESADYSDSEGKEKQLHGRGAEKGVGNKKCTAAMYGPENGSKKPSGRDQTGIGGADKERGTKDKATKKQKRHSGKTREKGRKQE